MLEEPKVAIATGQLGFWDVEMWLVSSEGHRIHQNLVHSGGGLQAMSIGDGSWLGHGSVVLPGAAIGKHVVIGANSVVTGEIPDNCVAAGVPARVIRRLDP